MDKYEPCLDLAKARVEEKKIRYFSAFKPNTPVLQYSLRAVGSTLPPSCRLYEPEAGLEALRAGSGAGGQHSFTLHVDMLRIATDISITNSLDSIQGVTTISANGAIYPQIRARFSNSRS
jgi:hypothetical protein